MTQPGHAKTESRREKSRARGEQRRPEAAIHQEGKLSCAWRGKRLKARAGWDRQRERDTHSRLEMCFNSTRARGFSSLCVTGATTHHKHLGNNSELFCCVLSWGRIIATSVTLICVRFSLQNAEEDEEKSMVIDKNTISQTGSSRLSPRVPAGRTTCQAAQIETSLQIASKKKKKKKFLSLS